jgi:N-methylhydantoinase B
MSVQTTDPVAVEIHRRALDNITSEMGVALVRTSGSPVVTDAMDFCTCLLDKHGNQLSLTAYVLVHTGSSLVGVRTLIEELEASGAQVRPGDGWIVNDPHHGGAVHQGDVGIIMPTFFDDEHVGWAFANVHVLDVGGTSVSGVNPAARTVYEEGLRFPLVRIISGGRLDSEWESFIAANVRVPGPVLNDLRGMIAANNVAQRKLADLIGRYGLQRHQELCEESQRLTAELFRRRIAGIPDGRYESTDWTEFDGHDDEDRLLEVSCTAEVRGTELHLAFSAVPQVDAYLNVGEGAMLGCSMTVLMTMLGYGDMPFNAGAWEPVFFDLGPVGTIVNPRSPAPVSAAHSESGYRVMKVLRDVLSQAMSLSDDPQIRGRIAGQHQDGACSVGVAGVNQHGRQCVVYYLDSAVGAGAGAQSIMDGQDCYGNAMMAGCGISDVETHEATDPVLFLWRRILKNSGGPGTFRGGQGLDQAYLIDSTDRLAGFSKVVCAEVPPRGFGGGLPGSASSIMPVFGSNAHELMAAGRQPLPEALDGDRSPIRNKQSPFVVRRGDVVRFLGGGGAGLGDPLLRDPAAVARDVADGYITTGHARTTYGVVVDDEGEVSADETASVRSLVLHDRLGTVPTRPMTAPATPGRAVVLNAARDAWACGYCATSLGAATDNWRAVAICLERAVVRALVDAEMLIRARRDEPVVLLREQFCPACAGCLSADVVLDGDAPVPSPKLAAGS